MASSPDFRDALIEPRQICLPVQRPAGGADSQFNGFAPVIFRCNFVRMREICATVAVQWAGIFLNSERSTGGEPCPVYVSDIAACGVRSRRDIAPMIEFGSPREAFVGMLSFIQRKNSFKIRPLRLSRLSD